MVIALNTVDDQLTFLSLVIMLTLAVQRPFMWYTNKEIFDQRFVKYKVSVSVSSDSVSQLDIYHYLFMQYLFSK